MIAFSHSKHLLNSDPQISSSYFTEGDFCCHLLFSFTQSQSLCLPSADLLAPYCSSWLVAHEKNVRPPAPCGRDEPLWETGKLNIVPPSRQGDELHTRGSDGLWWFIQRLVPSKSSHTSPPAPPPDGANSTQLVSSLVLSLVVSSRHNRFQ